MEPSPISASLGAMGSLPRKLDELLATKHWTLRGIVMDGIQQLTADLRILHSFMLKISNAQDPPMSARCWMKDVRELSYDMEDFADQFGQAHGPAKIFSLKRRHHAHGRAKIRRAILRKLISRMKDMREPSSSMEKFVDQFIHAHGCAKIRQATCRKLVSRLKISRLPGRRRWRPWITDMVSEFRTRAQDATELYQRYKLDDCVPKLVSRTVHELPTMLQDPGDLVGIEGPMNELERWLINNGEEQLKVVSVVGVGGIGKTTLAQKLCGKLHVQFECGAFVRTAQKPDMRGILRNILLQVRPHQPPNAGQMGKRLSQLPSPPSTVTSGPLKSGSSVEESKELTVSSSQFPVGLGHTVSVANVGAVAQLIEQATGLVSRIIQAVVTTRQNKQECEHLALHLSIIGDVLPRLLQAGPVVERPLKELGKALGEAHDLVLACQDRSAANQFIRARRHRDSFRGVNARIDSILGLFPLVNFIAITSLLARISTEHTGVQTTITVPSPGSSSGSLQTQTVVPDYPCMFTWAEIARATNNFADKLGRGCSGTVYKGRLHDGPEVAVKVLDKHRPHDTFVPELVITFRLRHDHIVRLVGWCGEEDGRMFVYEHMSNGTLRDHLHGGSSSSPVTTSWETRVEVLLGVARAIHYLHRGADPLVIHRNVSSSNILLDANWTPRLSGFGSAVFQAAGVEEHGGQLVEEVVGMPRYIDPEYSGTHRVSTGSDVYSFGVVVLEALTGRPPDIYGVTLGLLVDSVLPSVHNGRLRDVLDGHPALQPTPRQLEALDLVAYTASRCLCPRGQNRRLAMSDVVANLHRALEIIRSN